MNMAYNDKDRNFLYQNDEEPSSTGRQKSQPKSRPNYSQKRSPSAFNGMHRRRNKRFSW
jgi:hypothetical protein